MGIETAIGLGLAGSAIGGGMSYLGASEAADASAAAANAEMAKRQEAYEILAGLKPIEMSQLQYDPEAYKYIEEARPLLYMSPEDVQAQLVQTAPETRNLQMQALQDMTQRSEEGLSARDRAALMRSKMGAEETARGQRGAIEEEMARRGISGGGLGMVQQQMAGQSAADRMALEGVNQAALDAQVRQEALNSLLSGAGQVRGQDINQATTNADILNRFAEMNSARKQAIQNKNVDLLNMQQAGNVAEQRRIGEMNTTQKNSADLLKENARRDDSLLYQQSVQDILKSKAGAKLGEIPSIQAQGAANAAQAAAPYQMGATIASGVGGMGSSYLQSMALDKMLNKVGGGQLYTRNPYSDVSYNVAGGRNNPYYMEP